MEGYSSSDREMEAEHNILGVLLSDPYSLGAFLDHLLMLSGQNFCTPFNAALFEHLKGELRARRLVDPITAAEAMAQRDDFEAFQLVHILDLALAADLDAVDVDMALLLRQGIKMHGADVSEYSPGGMLH